LLDYKKTGTKPMKTTEHPTLTSASFEDLVQEMLVRLGEDPQREGLQQTPQRVRKSLQFLTRGYTEDPEALLKGALFTVTYDEMVIVKDIEMFSLCEHHLLPFFGKVHVAYIPNGKVIGLSKVPRLIEVFSRRLQIQERLTTQIAETIQKVIEPQGVGVVIEARHLCMMKAALRRRHFVHAGLLPQRRRNALRIPLANPPAPEWVVAPVKDCVRTQTVWVGLLSDAFDLAVDVAFDLGMY
jgi:GTP cyclohydrolase I